MKRRLLLLYGFDRVLTEALFGAGAAVLIEGGNLKIQNESTD
jgi:hypothetical protein